MPRLTSPVTIYYKVPVVIQPGGPRYGQLEVLLLDDFGGLRTVRLDQLETAGGTTNLILEIEQADVIL
jgi:hypothetical protein